MDGMKTGITFGAFDLLHAGHILMFQECKTVCDYLIVGLQTDPTIDRPEKNKPIEAIWERFFKLEAIKDIDKVIPYATEQDLYDLLTAIFPDVRIIGQDWQDKNYTGKGVAKDVYFNTRTHNLSSSRLKERVIKGVK